MPLRRSTPCWLELRLVWNNVSGKPILRNLLSGRRSSSRRSVFARSLLHPRWEGRGEPRDNDRSTLRPLVAMISRRFEVNEAETSRLGRSTLAVNGCLSRSHLSTPLVRVSKVMMPFFPSKYIFQLSLSLCLSLFRLVSPRGNS